jgi:hypothetical protein
VVASDDEQVQIPAYGRQRLGADAAQLTSGSLIGHGTDLLGHGERDLPQPGVLIRGNPYVMVKSAIAGGERHREEQSGITEYRWCDTTRTGRMPPCSRPATGLRSYSRTSPLVKSCTPGIPRRRVAARSPSPADVHPAISAWWAAISSGPAASFR